MTIRTKAYEVMESQDVLQHALRFPWTVNYAFVNKLGYIWLKTNGGSHYIGRVSREVQDWLQGELPTVVKWTVTGGETSYEQGHATIKNFGLNLVLHAEHENGTLQSTQGVPIPEGQPRQTGDPGSLHDLSGQAGQDAR